MTNLRARLVAFVDVAPDMRHVSLIVGAPLKDGRVQIETAGAWDSTEAARQALRLRA